MKKARKMALLGALNEYINEHKNMTDNDYNIIGEHICKLVLDNKKLYNKFGEKDKKYFDQCRNVGLEGDEFEKLCILIGISYCEDFRKSKTVCLCNIL